MIDINVTISSAPTLEVSFVEDAVEVELTTTPITLDVSLIAPPGNHITDFGPRLEALESTAVLTGSVDW